jgi:hypothetical protein
VIIGGRNSKCPAGDAAGSAGRRDPGELPELVLGAGDGRGFGGFVSPAKLALANGLDPVGRGFELRIHGVGGSSPEQMLVRNAWLPA